MLRRSLLGLAVVALAACSSSSSEPATVDARAGDITGQDVWKNGVVLSGIVTITPNAVVEIEPGATIKCSEGTTLYVAGTLRARSAAKHAKITCKAWLGVSVNAGGKVDLEGLDIENSVLGLGLAEGALDSTYSKGSIVSARKPLFVGKGAKLSVTEAKVSAPDTVADNEISISDVYGTLVASHLEYDAKTNEGISAKNGGVVEIEDSILKGSGGRDMVSSYGGKSVKVSYTTMQGAHCGIHIDNFAEAGKPLVPTAAFAIDHVSSDPNSYGITIYGSGAGPNTVTQSNLVGSVAWLDFAGDNGPITFDGVYTNGSQVMNGGPAPTFKNKATAPIANAKPR